MKRTLIAMVSLGVACLVTSGASAMQNRAAAREDVQRMHHYVQCVARAKSDRARGVLAMNPGDRSFSRALERLVMPDERCQHRFGEAQRGRAIVARMNSLFLSGRMAEALLVDDLGGGDLAPRVALDPSRGAIPARNEEEVMSICTVRAAPTETAAIFVTEPASREETAAVRAISPRIAECLVAGATGTFDAATIRSMLGLAAYRLVQHNAALAAARN